MNLPPIHWLQPEQRCLHSRSGCEHNGELSSLNSQHCFLLLQAAVNRCKEHEVTDEYYSVGYSLFPERSSLPMFMLILKAKLLRSKVVLRE